MIRFNNDYNHGAHPSVLEELAATNAESYGGYGEDEWCDKASVLIRELTAAPAAEVHFFPGATQANFVVTAAALSPIQSVISAETGHINCHEAASIEKSGHKILALPGHEGKISADQIEQCAADYYRNEEPEYLTQPRMVYISFPTEQGTIYSLQELTEISEVCHKYSMLLFIDGARMGYGLGAENNDVTLKDIARLADVFYIGGTKCGALFGEALVITDIGLKRKFKTYMKQNGAVLAKGWLLGLQFYTLLKDGTYFSITQQADRLAMKLKSVFTEEGIPLWVDSLTNQQFVLLSDQEIRTLGENYIFEIEGKDEQGRNIVRFCTSWATTEQEVDALIGDVRRL